MELALGWEMAVVLVRQAHLAPGADLGDGVDGGSNFGVDGGEDVLEGEAFEGWEVVGVGVGGGLLFSFHGGCLRGVGGGSGGGVGADEDRLGACCGAGFGGGDIVFVGRDGAVQTS